MIVLNFPQGLLVGSMAISSCLAQDEVPSVQSFIRRGSSLASIIGNYIYFDSGEIAQEGYNDFRTNNQVNSTLSIDLAASWRPQDVKIQEIPKPDRIIRMRNQAIFTDEKNGVFYPWGGHTSWFADIGDPELIHFRADGKGGGEWVEDNPSNTFKNAERVESSAYASTPDGGFAFGGSSAANTSKEPKGNVAGFVSFNFTTKEWTSDSSAPYSSDGSLYGGTATFVPTFGPNGIIILLGGMTQAKTSDVKYLDFRTLYFIDPVTRDWNYQVTTGDTPSGRYHHCATGVASSNGTFEIFIFGGSNTLSKSDYSDMYTLSLPGFRWTRVSGLDNEARAEHTCAVVGKRQLLSWGGNNDNRKEGRWEAKDTFPQGIGIFDMTELKWKGEYDPLAEEYESHSSIKSWYDNGGMKSVNWSSNEVKKMFVGETDKEDNIDDKDNSNGQDQGESKKTPVGAIAGGVVGGTIILLAIAFGIWFYWRKHRRSVGIPQSSHRTPPIAYQQTPKIYDPANPSELPDYSRPSELKGESVPAELGGFGGEMGGGGK